MPDDLPRWAATLGARLRASGVKCDQSSAVTFAHSFPILASSDPLDLYWATRLSFVRRAEDIATFDRVFASLVLGDASDHDASDSATDETDQALGEAQAETTDEGEIASDLELLRDKDFASLTDEERAVVARLLASLAARPPARVSRRTVPARDGRALDGRRTLRAGLRAGGEPIVLHRRERRHLDRRVVFLLDISGSMKAYTRPLVQYAWAMKRMHRATEVFCFGTSITRVTPVLERSNIDAALDEVGHLVPDWGGGTLIGTALSRFLTGWGRRGLARGAIVVVCSDGLGRDDPAVVARSMAQLHRLGHRIVWVNPLAADPGYEPSARAMAAALPHVDNFIQGRNLAGIEELAAVVAS